MVIHRLKFHPAPCDGDCVLAEDILGSAPTTLTTPTGGVAAGGNTSVGSGADLDLATKTQDYAATSLAVGVGMAFIYGGSNDFKVRLYMGGVQVAESGWVPGFGPPIVIVMGTRALSGSQECKIAAHNYDPASKTLNYVGTTSAPATAAIGIGIASVKT